MGVIGARDKEENHVVAGATKASSADQVPQAFQALVVSAGPNVDSLANVLRGFPSEEKHIIAAIASRFGNAIVLQTIAKAHAPQVPSAAAHVEPKTEASHAATTLQGELQPQLNDVTATGYANALNAFANQMDDENSKKFIATLDRITDPDVRSRVKVKFEKLHHKSLEQMIRDCDHWNNNGDNRDKTAALNLIGSRRDQAEESIAKMPPEVRALREREAEEAAVKILAACRASDHSDENMQKLFHELGNNDPERIEMIRIAVQRQSKGKTNLYQAIDDGTHKTDEDIALSRVFGEDAPNLAGDAAKRKFEEGDNFAPRGDSFDWNKFAASPGYKANPVAALENVHATSACNLADHEGACQDTTYDTVSSVAAGFGDGALILPLGSAVRQFTGWGDDTVHTDTKRYNGGQLAGIGLTLGLGGIKKLAGGASAAKESQLALAEKSVTTVEAEAEANANKEAETETGSQPQSSTPRLSGPEIEQKAKQIGHAAVQDGYHAAEPAATAAAEQAYHEAQAQGRTPPEAEAAAREAAQKVADAAVKARMKQLKAQGHGPGRHGPDVTAEQLEKRAMKGVDPMTGTTTDYYPNNYGNPKPHAAARNATKFNAAKDMVRAEEYVRSTPQYREELANAEAKGERQFEVKAKLEDVYGPSYQEKVSGYTREGSAKNPTGGHETNFENGNVTARYEKTATPGEWKVVSVYPEPQ